MREKTGEFKALERAVMAFREIPSIEGMGEYILSMEVGHALQKLAEQISERDETPTEAWNGLFQIINSIEAGTDEVPSKDEIARVRQGPKSARRDEVPPVPSIEISSLAGLYKDSLSLAEVLPLADILKNAVARVIDAKQPPWAQTFYPRAFAVMRNILRLFVPAISEGFLPRDLASFYLRGELQMGDDSRLEWVER